MNKKVIIGIIAIVVILVASIGLFVMVGKENTPSLTNPNINSNDKENTNNNDKTSSKYDFSKELDWYTYKIVYPNGTQGMNADGLSRADYGYSFSWSDEFVVYISAPCRSGIMYNIAPEDFATAIESCKQNNCDAMWSTIHAIADISTPAQIVDTTEKVVKNGIDMLKVKGRFISTSKYEEGREVEYISYYMLPVLGNGYCEPIYITGLKWNTDRLEEFMDDMASHITRNI